MQEDKIGHRKQLTSLTSLNSATVTNVVAVEELWCGSDPSGGCSTRQGLRWRSPGTAEAEEKRQQRMRSRLLILAGQEASSKGDSCKTWRRWAADWKADRLAR
ncbi:hypothetical protein ACJRO7_015142 [Eucalyptus globulus]|uniref:Uncharacterized protein n=1 Tax=Eucalyptus globulus TaxID=34317 RepID=A0ABD3L6F9_EUCGL